MLPFGFLSQKALSDAQEFDFMLEPPLFRFLSAKCNPGNWPSTTTFHALPPANRLAIYQVFFTYIEVHSTDNRTSKVRNIIAERKSFAGLSF